MDDDHLFEGDISPGTLALIGIQIKEFDEDQMATAMLISPTQVTPTQPFALFLSQIVLDLWKAPKLNPHSLLGLGLRRWKLIRFASLKLR